MKSKKQTGLKMKKIAIIRGETAEAIFKALDESGILEYKERTELGHMVLDVYTQKQESQ